MTEEEKAEEYAKGKAHEHYHFLFEENSGSPVDFAKLCYLDGLAEGKPKWHDLRKDPNDLPKGDEDCLCFISECYFVGHYAKEDKEWHFDEFISNGVIAWCELPKFEE
ncbi:MAG: hypothetical protein MJZ11_08355 [Lachnospiraceae bacterium]|nr:hypothetical protein [Lachnospiraceae bacterium]